MLWIELYVGIIIWQISVWYIVLKTKPYMPLTYYPEYNEFFCDPIHDRNVQRNNLTGACILVLAHLLLGVIR